MQNPNEKWIIVKAILCVVFMFCALIDSIFGGDRVDAKDYDLSFGDRIGTYRGETENDIPNGNGTLDILNEEGVMYYYIGNFVNGHFEGEGMTVWEFYRKYEEPYGLPEQKFEMGIYKNDQIVPLKGEELINIFYDQEMYTYHCVEFTGVVSEKPIYTGELVALSITIDISNCQKQLIARIYDTDFEIYTGDYIRIMGIIESYNRELNNDEEVNLTPVIVAYEYDAISYEEAMSPELIKQNPNKKYLKPAYYVK